MIFDSNKLINQFSIILNDESIYVIKISEDLVMTLGELRQEIDNKQIDILKGKDYAFEIDKESVFENELEY